MCGCGCGSVNKLDCKCGDHCACKHDEMKSLTSSPATVGSFREQLIELWDDHISLTRMCVMSGVAGSKDLDVTVQRLLLNQDDIGSCFKYKYGDNVAKSISKALREHIDIAGKIIGAVVSGKSIDVLDAQWKRNAVEIADTMYKLKPSVLSQQQWRDHMLTHLALLTQELLKQNEGDYVESIRYYNSSAKQARMMAIAMYKIAM